MRPISADGRHVPHLDLRSGRTWLESRQQAPVKSMIGHLSLVKLKTAGPLVRNYSKMASLLTVFNHLA